MTERLVIARKAPLSKGPSCPDRSLHRGAGRRGGLDDDLSLRQHLGFMLLGHVQKAPVTDWRFLNDIPLCQIQLYVGPMPHAVNLNCMATENGDLLLSLWRVRSQVLRAATWKTARTAACASMAVYPVTFTRVKHAAVSDQAWAARVKKLQVYGAGLQPCSSSRRETARRVAGHSAALGR